MSMCEFGDEETCERPVAYHVSVDIYSPLYDPSIPDQKKSAWLCARHIHVFLQTHPGWHSSEVDTLECLLCGDHIEVNQAEFINFEDDSQGVRCLDRKTCRLAALENYGVAMTPEEIALAWWEDSERFDALADPIC